MAILANSRYLLTNVVQVVNPITGNLVFPEYVDLRQRVTATAPDDRFIIPTMFMDSWARLSLQYLVDAKAWWVIADLSGVVDAFSDLDTAVAASYPLRIPSVTRYLFSILSPQQLAG